MRLLPSLSILAISISSFAQSPCAEESAAWMEKINRVDDLRGSYAEKPVIIRSNLKLLDTNPSLTDYFEEISDLFKGAEVSTVSCINASGDIYYEINEIQESKKASHSSMVIWRGNTKEFEIIASNQSKNFDQSEIDQRRKDWMKLCNEHNAYKLVSDLYEPEAIYYNHRPVDIGTEKIARTYSYMNRETYSLTLTPIIIHPVTNSLVYEIGQCSGSYGGKYMLIWRKNSEGVWQILFDSNI